MYGIDVNEDHTYQHGYNISDILQLLLASSRYERLRYVFSLIFFTFPSRISEMRQRRQGKLSLAAG